MQSWCRSQKPDEYLETEHELLTLLAPQLTSAKGHPVQGMHRNEWGVHVQPVPYFETRRIRVPNDLPLWKKYSQKIVRNPDSSGFKVRHRLNMYSPLIPVHSLYRMSLCGRQLWSKQRQKFVFSFQIFVWLLTSTPTLHFPPNPAISWAECPSRTSTVEANAVKRSRGFVESEQDTGCCSLIQKKRIVTIIENSQKILWTRRF
jgi:hypothetical protein